MSDSVRKVCLLGDFAVGKTSLVSRYVNNVFSDRYLTTVGVKVDTRVQAVDANTQVKLVVWDLAGAGTLSVPARTYIQGSHAFLVVCDGTRRATLDGALSLLANARGHIGPRPAVLLVNKQDLSDSWEVDQDMLDVAREQCQSVLATSAKTGANVERAFKLVAELVAALDRPH
jgi:small GTP-binding protein